MGIIDIGEVIKSERKKKGLTQDDLAFGLCTTATLSRIENGIHSPNQELLDGLLERLGTTDYSFSYTDKNDSFFDYEIEATKNAVVAAYTANQIDALLEHLTKLKNFETSYDILDEQFINTYTYMYLYKTNELEKLDYTDIINSLNITINNFNEQDSFSYLLTDNEKLLLFLLAMYDKYHGKTVECKRILSNLAENFETYTNSYEYVELLYIDTLHELADICILFEEYAEANTHIDKYIAYCKEHATYSFIPYIRYQKALCSLWANNLNEARENIVKAYYHLLALQRTDDAECLRTKAEQELNIRFKITITRN